MGISSTGFLYPTYSSSYLVNSCTFPGRFFLSQAAFPFWTVSTRNWYPSDCNDSIFSLFKIEHSLSFQTYKWNFNLTRYVPEISQLLTAHTWSITKYYLEFIKHVLSSKHLSYTTEWFNLCYPPQLRHYVLPLYTGKPSYRYTYALQKCILTLITSLKDCTHKQGEDQHITSTISQVIQHVIWQH